MSNRDKLIRDAQYRKGLSIAFFNATNSAVALVVQGVKPEEGMLTEVAVAYWRDWFIAEHDKYYAEVIANVGANYNVAETIKKLEAAASSEELYDAWMGLSEDERRDPKVIEVKNKMKEKYA